MDIVDIGGYWWILVDISGYWWILVDIGGCGMLVLFQLSVGSLVVGGKGGKKNKKRHFFLKGSGQR